MPADHGYQLSSALTKAMGEIHNKREFAVYNISGDPIDNRLLKLNDGSRLAFRLNSENIERLLHLANVKCSQCGLCWKESPTSAIVNIREKEGDPI